MSSGTTNTTCRLSVLQLGVLQFYLSYYNTVWFHILNMEYGDDHIGRRKERKRILSSVLSNPRMCNPIISSSDRTNWEMFCGKKRCVKSQGEEGRQASPLLFMTGQAGEHCTFRHSSIGNFSTRFLTSISLTLNHFSEMKCVNCDLGLVYPLNPWNESLFGSFLFIADPNAYGKTVEYAIQVFIDNNRLEN